MREHQGMMPKLISREKEEFQMRDNYQMKSNGEQSNSEQSDNSGLEWLQ